MPEIDSTPTLMCIYVNTCRSILGVRQSEPTLQTVHKTLICGGPQWIAMATTSFCLLVLILSFQVMRWRSDDSTCWLQGGNDSVTFMIQGQHCRFDTGKLRAATYWSILQANKLDFSSNVLNAWKNSFVAACPCWTQRSLTSTFIVLLDLCHVPEDWSCLIGRFVPMFVGLSLLGGSRLY